MKKIALLVLLIFGSKVCAQDMALKTNLLYDATTTINLGYEVALGKKLTLDIWGNYNPWTLGYKWVGVETESGTFRFADEREKKLKHWMVQPEVRWWLCEKFNGHFFGVHVHGGQFNVGAMSLPFGIGRYKYEFAEGFDQFDQPYHDDARWGDYLGKYPSDITLEGGSGVKGVMYKAGKKPYTGLVNYAGYNEANDQYNLDYANADRDGIYTNSFEGWFVGAGVSYGYHWILAPRFSMEFTIGVGFAYLNYEKTRCTDCKVTIGEDTDWYIGPTRLGIGLVWMIK